MTEALPNPVNRLGSERRAVHAVAVRCFIPLVVLLGLAACEESSGVPDGGDAGLMTDAGGTLRFNV